MVGVDEVGRGALAGPLLVVAARLSGNHPAGLTDSKLLSRAKREAIFEQLISNFEFGEGWVDPVEIDQAGLGAALRLGVHRALNELGVSDDEEIVMDGIVNYLPAKHINGRCEVGADLNLSAVSAASVYAKVRRDRYMLELAKRHKSFSFSEHVGYGTPRHHQELRLFGPLERVHRYSFEPVRRAGQP